MALLLLAGSQLISRHRHKPVPPPVLPIPLPVFVFPDPPGIVLHSSDTPARMGGKPVNAAMLEQIHSDDHPDWATPFQGKVYHIGYHYVILPNGKIEPGRPEHCIGTHAKHHNTWIGICVVGAFSAKSDSDWWPQRPTRAQVDSVVGLCERLMSKYHIPPEMVKRHRDVNDTYCPGGRFPYKRILARLQTYAAAHPETRPIKAEAVVSRTPAPISGQASAALSH